MPGVEPRPHRCTTHAKLGERGGGWERRRSPRCGTTRCPLGILPACTRTRWPRCSAWIGTGTARRMVSTAARAYLLRTQHGFAAQPCCEAHAVNPSSLPDVQLIPRKLLLGNPSRLAPELSPDGQMLAWRAPVADVLNIWVAPVGAI